MGFREYLVKNKLEISEGTGTEKDSTDLKGDIQKEKDVAGKKSKKNQKGRKKEA